jgi:sensor c-di-GMP phosphodiesterase-like protein
MSIVSPDGGDASWLQWAVTSALGLFTVAYGGALAHLWQEIAKVRDRQDTAANAARERAEKGDDALRATIDELRRAVEQMASRDEIERLRTMMEQDRRLAAIDRANIAAAMVTRAELERQIDRVVGAFSQQARLNSPA